MTYPSNVMDNEKYLIAFDFDHTIIDANSDTWIYKLGKDGNIPERIKSTYEEGEWTRYMNVVFEYLHKNQGVTSEEYRKTLNTIPLTDGMEELMSFLAGKTKQFDAIIISDSNSWFIQTILSQKLSGLEFEIFTNRASFNPDGMLVVQPYHNHSHEACPRNMCKGNILESLITKARANGTHYRKVFYVGDGGNDFCPVQRLSKNDVVFARKGYRLHKRLSKTEILSGVVVWENGNEIISVVQKYLNE